MKTNRLLLPALLASAVAATPLARAQYDVTVISLVPGEHWSGALATTGSQQAGDAYMDVDQHAGFWSGTAASWVDLNPAGSSHSVAYATTGDQQAGYAEFGGSQHAGIWSGTAASWVDLNPVGAVVSFARATTGSQQAGYAAFDSYQYHSHAGTWSGTAASWVDLNPAGANWSSAFATAGSQQAGGASFGSGFHAGIWSGTAASWVDLNPAGADDSSAYATTGSQQAGQAGFGGVNVLYHAGIWSGTAASWVDLNPAGAEESDAVATTGSHQAGWAYINGDQHAGIWSGTAGSWFDLGDGAAEGIWSDGKTIYVVGCSPYRVCGTQTFFNGATLWTLTAMSDPTGICITDLKVQPKANMVELTWTDLGNAGGAGGGYNVHRGDLPGGPYALIGKTPAGVSLYDDTTAVSGHAYYFIVRAVAATGVETCQSNEAEGEARCAPPVAAVNVYGGNRGYYILNATSGCGPASQLKIYLVDADSSFVAGPYPDGKTLRLLRSKDGKTGTGPGFGPASITITVLGRQALVYAVDPAGQVGQSVRCTSR